MGLSGGLKDAQMLFEHFQRPLTELKCLLGFARLPAQSFHSLDEFKLVGHEQPAL
jgi:hypothetical protein